MDAEGCGNLLEAYPGIEHQKNRDRLIASDRRGDFLPSFSFLMVEQTDALLFSQLEVHGTNYESIHFRILNVREYTPDL